MTTTIVTLIIGATVRIDNPYAPDFSRTGQIIAVHHAETDSPSYVVQPSGADYCRTYGVDELAVVAPAPLTPAELTEAHALRNELLSVRRDMFGVGGGKEALNSVRGLLSFAAEWDAMATGQRTQFEAAQDAWAEWTSLLALVDAGAYDDLAPALAWAAAPLVLVPSETTLGGIYAVQGGRCTCKAGQFGRACKHLKTAAA